MTFDTWTSERNSFAHIMQLFQSLQDHLLPWWVGLGNPDSPVGRGLSHLHFLLITITENNQWAQVITIPENLPSSCIYTHYVTAGFRGFLFFPVLSNWGRQLMSSEKLYKQLPQFLHLFSRERAIFTHLQFWRQKSTKVHLANFRASENASFYMSTLTKDLDHA